MQIITSPADMQAFALQCRREGHQLALVPTMGFLHEGHRSLVRVARERGDVVVVSVFVNPTQFGPDEDFDAYPRDFDRDCAVCRQEGADVVFHPDPESIYGASDSVHVEETRLGGGLCGESRPGHFRGVVTVVTKLFNLTQPDIAVFGAKDAQQARIIQQLSHDLCFPVEILIAPIVREPDGLAMSSRNTHLDAEQRKSALRIHAALQIAQEMHERGQRDAAAVCTRIREYLSEDRAIEIDYVAAVDWNDFEPVSTLDANSLVAVAVTIGKTRLIDNIIPACGAFPGFVP